MRDSFLTLSLLAILLTVISCSTSQVRTVTIEGVRNPPSEMMENPFYEKSSLPFETPDFNNIRVEDYLPAFERGMEEQINEVEAIAENNEEPTLENTLVALEESGQTLRRVRQVFFPLTSAHVSKEIREIQSEIAPRLSAHFDDILLNDRLFERVSTLYERKEEMELDPESERLLEEWRRSFIRAGARLNEQDQRRIREINERTSELTTRFQEKLMTMTRESAVFVENRQELEGLSENRIEAAAEAARDHGEQSGYLLTLTNTTRQPVLEQLENRELRARVWRASANRGIGEGDGVDTRPLVLELVEMRDERARILGYPDWASYTIERQTAGTPERVLEMLEEMVPMVTANSSHEAEQIREMMDEDGIEEAIQPWDWDYYAERVRSRNYDLDDEMVRSYLELERVLQDGVFHTMERLYGIRFKERYDLPVYHPDVRTFTVLNEDDDEIGLFYLDLFERESKRGGAWMSTFVNQSHLLDQKPVVTNVLNIPRPADGEPVLVSFDHVTTLFHEMGHAVHGLFSDVTYPTLSGTSVPRDFVEFPSTFHEDWAFHPDILDNYAVHHESGETIPPSLRDRVIEARQFNQGFDTQEYLAAALLDLEWHTLPENGDPADVQSFEEEALAGYGLDNPAIPPRYRSPYFAHVFAGGYSASYYAYIWSEVMAADAFVYMNERGLNRESGDHFRETILSRGASREAMDLYLEFRGEEPDVSHLLRRRGLLVDEE